MAVTVTVVMCDVEGSTALLERFGEERSGALQADYEARLAELCAEHGGTRKAGAGDGRLLAFGSVRAALRCAVALQRALGDAELPFRVRAGVHTGELERHDGELRGRALVKAARICALARGGEVLASAVVPNGKRVRLTAQCVPDGDRGLVLALQVDGKEVARARDTKPLPASTGGLDATPSLRAYPRPDSKALADLAWDDFEVRKATVATP
jgi:class 3 adenylate cyclase